MQSKGHFCTEFMMHRLVGYLSRTGGTGEDGIGRQGWTCQVAIREVAIPSLPNPALA